MKFTIVGIEHLSRTNKETGATSNAIQLYLTYQTPNVVGSAVREEWFGDSSPVYPALRNYLSTNVNVLIGGQINLDYDVITGKNGSYKKLLGFELFPKK